jgi:glycosyltransferase involved in cell wall biosynthesis
VKILWVKTNLLHPLDSGGTIRSYQMLRHLKQDHEITYVALETQHANGAASRAAEYCDQLVQVPWGGAPPRSEWRFYMQALANLRSSLPLALERYHVPALRHTIRQLAEAEVFDAAISDFLFPALHFDVVRRIPKLLFQHNVESLIWERMAERSRGIARRYFESQARRMRFWEGKLAQTFDHVVTVSMEDARLMHERFGIRSTTPVPTGVDTTYYTPPPAALSGRDVVFVGSLDWLPNIDAVHWTLSTIWPQIRSRRPDTELYIVGRRPSRALRHRIQAAPRAHLRADVPDIREYLWRAAVVLVPLRVGGGTRLKIFEAFACAKAVVSTPVGAEGLPVTPGTHALIESDASRLADATVGLLEDEQRRRELGNAGRELVERRFGWDRVAEAFSNVCASLAPVSRPRP